MNPLQIKITDKKNLYIKWDDGVESLIKLTNLRRNCPCASCLTERESQSSSYIPLYNDDQITVADIKLTGNYAIQIIWKDGHNTGIYEFNDLRSLSGN